MNPISSITGGAAADAASTAAKSATAGGTTQVTKNMFLQLLVAQIKHQDPLNPSDGVQFLTQLAQFQQMEQSVNMGQDVSAMRTDLDKIVQSGGTDAQQI